LSIKGIQITGQAKLITGNNPEYDNAMRVYKWENLGKELGWTKPPRGYTIIKVEAEKIELTEIALKQKGYSHHQVWEA